ncbi:PQQ-dependent sugar dehydrogenase [Caldalkalibacillus salinus]|uniref:PQQ-dependent sugar dehydrogenase n=1 Tax=Caldalkalibacillus salinus TaxID=2803787 RepID=UPI0019223248|nr:PQQ-dependent sugar dehydrogenase [Caldalkalibacillus salinus]
MPNKHMTHYCKGGMVCFMILSLLIGCAQNEELGHQEQTTVAPDYEEQRPSQNGDGQEGVGNEEDTEERTDDEERTTDGGFIRVTKAETLASNLDIPWAMTKWDGVFFITQREGSMARVENGQVRQEELKLTKDVLHHGEGGLLGFTLDPDFDDNHLAYVYHTYREEGTPYNRVAAVQYLEGTWVEQRSVIEGIRGDQFHNGGRLKIGPDGLLYITTGDAWEGEQSQDHTTLAGSILRLERDGSIPEDNPFRQSPVYSYGHRNPQGLAWDATEQVLYSSEHGPQGYDEINRIVPGKNYGWPTITGDQQQKDLIPPLFHSGEDTWAPSGMIFHRGIIYVACLRGSMVRAFDPHTGATDVIWQGEGRIRDIHMDDDERLYIITNNIDGRGQPDQMDDRLIELHYEELK